MKYKVGDVLLFGGDDWMLVVGEEDTVNITIEKNTLFVGAYNPMTDRNPTSPVLFNIFDIKKKVEENGY